MANTPGISGQSTPDGEDRKSAECPPDSKLPENSQENLDSRLDHAIEETFPTSDPVSVTITKGPEPDRPEKEAHSLAADNQQGEPEQGSTEQVLDQVREALNDVARQTREQDPQAERYVREGQRAVSHRMAENPLLSLLVAGAIGYVLAWMIHGEKRDRKTDVPDYGRTSRGYAPHREQQHS